VISGSSPSIALGARTAPVTTSGPVVTTDIPIGADIVIPIGPLDIDIPPYEDETVDTDDTPIGIVIAICMPSGIWPCIVEVLTEPMLTDPGMPGTGGPS